MEQIKDERPKEVREEDDEKARKEFQTDLTASQNIFSLMSILVNQGKQSMQEMVHAMTNMAGVTMETALVNDYFVLCEGTVVRANAIQIRPEQWKVWNVDDVDLDPEKVYSREALEALAMQVGLVWRYFGSAHGE